MKLFSIFKKGEILTESDRTQLEKLEETTASLRQLRDRVDREWVGASNRIEKLQSLTGELIQRPHDGELWHRLEMTAAMPSNLATGFQHIEAVKNVIGFEIDRLMLPQHAIVRRVFQRALKIAEAELVKTDKVERVEAEDGGYEFLPSGKVLALQTKVLHLRNAVGVPLPEEADPFRSAGEWRERLAEYL